jgi:hypothetical protein
VAIVVGAGLLVIGVVVLATRGGGGSGATRASAAGSANAGGASPMSNSAGSSDDGWWTPPPGSREDVEALAYAFSGVDEKDLGTVYDADLKPVYGAAKLFEDHQPRHVPRDELFSQVIELRDSMQLSTGFNILFVDLSTQRSSTHDYQLYRAVQVADVYRVDESKRMRKPPDNAIFYLAEVDRGASYDVSIEGDYADMGSQLSLMFEAGTASYGDLNSSGRYKMSVRGLGLKPKTTDAIFARTPDQIAARYETTAEPVPIKLVFRTIPGRHYRKREIPVPKTVLDEQLDLEDGAAKSWSIPTGGKYRLRATSVPNGLGVKWSAGVNCNATWAPDGEYKSFDIACTVPSGSTLAISNPSTFNMGPSEHMSIYLARLP